MNLNIEFKETERKVLEFLFLKSGKTFTPHQISKKLNISSPAILSALRSLKSKDIVKMEKNEVGRFSVKLNRDNMLVLGLKRAWNLEILYRTGFVKSLYDYFPGATVILFGSYSNGEDTCKSDIDIAVVGMKRVEVNMKKFENILEREINIEFFDSFKNIDKHLLNSLLNGIVLKGVVDI